MIILVNANAHGGKAAARWARVAPAVAERHPHRAVVTQSHEEALAAIEAALAEGAPVIASAGGDGGVNMLLNALLDPETDAMRAPVALGAVGLGSSNDFHQPMAPARAVAGVPVALDAASARRMDVGRVDWVDAEGRAGTRYFLLNASLGATAKGNHRYNHPDGVLAAIKQLSPDLAIHWGTLEAIAMFENVPVELFIDGEAVGRVAVSNMGVIKRPHFCGGMRYDTPVSPDDGHFDVNLLEGADRLGFVRAVSAISQGRFLGLAGARHWRAREVEIRPEAPTALEMDGEVVTVAHARMRVVPGAIPVCG